MKIEERINLLADRINQAHYLEYHFRKVFQEAYNKGVMDTMKKKGCFK